jgi:triacylglycerol esterase/lipase EstA (alpha/beta hydrolase family)
VIKQNIPDIFLIRDAVSYNIPHRNADSAKEYIKYQAVCQGYFNREVIDKIKNGKVDPHDEGPQTKINGNGSCIQENRVLHTPQFVVDQ